MQYPIAIESGSDTAACGVVVLDLPGCFSAGDTLDEALAGAHLHPLEIPCSRCAIPWPPR